MIRLAGRAATYGELWYEESPDAAKHRVDILIYRRHPEAKSARRHSAFLSLVTDLDREEAAIQGDFDKECRYQINRAEEKDGLRMACFPEPGPRLREFRDFYDAFARQKGLEPCDRHWLDGAHEDGRLLLSVASQGETQLVWHAYLLCGKFACLQHSASCFRDRASDYRSLVGRANRWLSWRDMLILRGMGYTRYDWGGLFEDESPPGHAGVNRFKRSFGGREFRTYDSVVPVSMRGRMYLPLRDMWRAGRMRLKRRADARIPLRDATHPPGGRPGP